VRIQGLLTADILQHSRQSNAKLWGCLWDQSQFTATIKALYEQFLLPSPGYHAVQTLHTISFEALTTAVSSLQFCSIGRHAPWHNMISRNAPRQVTSQDRGLNQGKPEILDSSNISVTSLQSLLHLRWIIKSIQFKTHNDKSYSHMSPFYL
jgi:hypothetical protein